MQTTPKSLRLQLGIFGRVNVGKSSFLNLLANQSISIVSNIAGTTTDVVEKAMELLPIGPILLLDSAGIDDNTVLGEARKKSSAKLFERADIGLVILNANIIDETEKNIIANAKAKNLSLIPIINKVDCCYPTDEFLSEVKELFACEPILCASNNLDSRDQLLNDLKGKLLQFLPDDFLKPPLLLEDLVEAKDTVIFIVPIDIQAPKGRLILPQVHLIRNALDLDVVPIVTKETEYIETLNNLKKTPALIVCDSQIVDFMVANTPKNIPCTTFSILFSRLKGDAKVMFEGAKALDNLKDGDKILIAEACTHHATDDDIGRVKIPRWIREKTKLNLQFDVQSGHDFPENLSEYKMIIHCGACMLNRRETLQRINNAVIANIPITNYGMAIAWSKGILDRVVLFNF